MICNFFLVSPKREGLLCTIVKENVQSNDRRKALIDLCRTRWSARHDAYKHFFQSFPYIVEALEVISLGFHLDKYESVRETYPDWDPKSKSDARSFLQAMTSFQFIVTFVTTYQY